MLLSIIKRLFGDKAHNIVPHRIYGTVVTQARNSCFFTDLGIPDTVMGRYDMLALHVFLVNRRLKYVESSDKLTASRLSQEIFDLFINDLERGLRDLGFADTSVHKRKRRLARSYYALIEEFDDALETGKPGILKEAIGLRYFEIFSEREKQRCVTLLEAYMFQAVDYLALQSIQGILLGDLNWPTISVTSVES
jgi:cytochrome b pre-mRNA-processing protein 3